MSESTPVEIIIGVDTHQHVHAAVAIDVLGARVGAMAAPVSTQGYRDLETWARSLGPIRAFGSRVPAATAPACRVPCRQMVTPSSR
jgi:transposase